MHTKYILLVALLLFLCTPLSFLKAQNKNGYTISGNIVGLKDSTKVILGDTDPSKSKSTFSRNGKFLFTGTIPVNGISPSITIEGLEGAVMVILDNHCKLNITCNVADWNTCNPKGSKAQEELNDFHDKIQRPFNKAWETYQNQVTKITGSKNPIEFFDKIPASLPITDSLRVALAVQTYQNAVINYPKDTMEWLCRHTNALYAPKLIQEWWPEKGLVIIYNALSFEVKNSYHGLNLKKTIDQMNKHNLKLN